MENILKTTMKLDSLENTDVTDSLNEVYEFLNKNLYGTEEFENLYDYLRGELDDYIRILWK